LEQQERAQEDRDRIRHAAGKRAIAHDRRGGVEGGHAHERSKGSRARARCYRDAPPVHIAEKGSMASKSKAKKKTGKARARKAAAPSAAKRASAPRASGGDESSEVLRASAKSFAARLLR